MAKSEQSSPRPQVLLLYAEVDGVRARKLGASLLLLAQFEVVCSSVEEFCGFETSRASHLLECDVVVAIPLTTLAPELTDACLRAVEAERHVLVFGRRYYFPTQVKGARFVAGEGLHDTDDKNLPIYEELLASAIQGAIANARGVAEADMAHRQLLEERLALWRQSGCAPEFLLDALEIEKEGDWLDKLGKTARQQLDPAIPGLVLDSIRNWLNDRIESWKLSERAEDFLLDRPGVEEAERLLRVRRCVEAHWPNSPPVGDEWVEFIRLSRQRHKRLDEERYTANIARLPSIAIPAPAIESPAPAMAASVSPEAAADRERRRLAYEAEVMRLREAQEKLRVTAVAGSVLSDDEMLRAARPRTPVRHLGDIVDEVELSVFAPPAVCRGAQLLVQVMLHGIEGLVVATARAQLIDETSALRGNAGFTVDLRRGTGVTVSLSDPRLEIEKADQQVTWHGRLTSVQFVARTPEMGASTLFPTVRVAVGPVIVGELRFKLVILDAFDPAGERQLSNEPRKTINSRYKRAFLSYSSRDRARVLEIAQAYRAAGIEFFQDLINLDPGSRWEKGLWKEIDACDLFLLFWTSDAARSEWVEKEVRYAIDRQQKSADRTPRIVPVILEGPPAPAPWAFVQHLHFDDWMRYAISALSVARAPGAPEAVPIPPATSLETKKKGLLARLFGV